MNWFSLRTVIDDILLIVRNNNISESEDMSRAQIASWVLTYKAQLAKQQREKDKETGEDSDNDDSLATTITVDLINDPDLKESGEVEPIRKRSKEKLPDFSGSSEDDIISASDLNGCVIQFMHGKRRHYHYFRRYTWAEPVCWYDKGYLYVEGDYGVRELTKINVTGNFSDDPEDEDDEDAIKIPGWMIPQIRALIMRNELQFMLKMPSDDSNNSTLASVKPHGPQDTEK